MAAARVVRPRCYEDAHIFDLFAVRVPAAATWGREVGNGGHGILIARAHRVQPLFGLRSRTEMATEEGDHFKCHQGAFCLSRVTLVVGDVYIGEEAPTHMDEILHGFGPTRLNRSHASPAPPPPSGRWPPNGSVRLLFLNGKCDLVGFASIDGVPSTVKR